MTTAEQNLPPIRRAWGGEHNGLVRYRNQKSAKRAIQNGQVKPELMCRLEVLACDECGGWHVMQVLLEATAPCPPIDVDKAFGMCTTKKAYPDEQMARRVAAEASRKRIVPLRHYQCPFCGFWHLTKSNQL